MHGDVPCVLSAVCVVLLRSIIRDPLCFPEFRGQMHEPCDGACMTCVGARLVASTIHRLTARDKLVKFPRSQAGRDSKLRNYRTKW